MGAMQLIMYVLTFVLLVLAGLNIGHARVSLGWLGMASWLVGSALLPYLT